jgi:hypothetical protein
MKQKITILSFLLPVLCAACTPQATEKKAVPGKVVYSCTFAEGEWKSEDWLRVKSPRWDYLGGWVQDKGFIRNEIPQDASDQEMLGKRAGETYSSMLYKDKLTTNVTVSATMDFAYRMAPLLVIAPELGKDAKGVNEYREHYEIVLYDEGVNIWHHYYADGKPFWKKVAHNKFALDKNRKYNMTVEIKTVKRQGVTKGKMIVVSVDGEHEFGVLDDPFPDEFYVGITGCEGLNRFYDFEIRK